eukprot:scaffold11690_cov50-Skeletonema_dohrnii-CCMP3373.AAC.1
MDGYLISGGRFSCQPARTNRLLFGVPTVPPGATSRSDPIITLFYRLFSGNFLPLQGGWGFRAQWLCIGSIWMIFV